MFFHGLSAHQKSVYNANSAVGFVDRTHPKIKGESPLLVTQLMPPKHILGVTYHLNFIV